jgi:hypothetical protein
MPTVFSERLGEVHLGKLPAHPLVDAVHMSEVVRILTKIGASLPALRAYDHSRALKNGSALLGGWGMGGNGPQDDGSILPSDAAAGGCGDCAISGPDREHMLEHHLSRNPGSVTFSCLRSVTNYATYTEWATPGRGYDPVSGANDSGCAIGGPTGVLAYRQQVGLLDDQGATHKIGQLIDGTPGDMQHFWLMGLLFQKVGFGMVFRDNNMREFDTGQPLTYVPTASDEGGHYFTSVGYVPDGGPMGRGAMWGESFKWRRSLYARQCDEVSTYVSVDMYNAATGLDSDQYDAQDLERFLAAWTQQAWIQISRPISLADLPEPEPSPAAAQTTRLLTDLMPSADPPPSASEASPASPGASSSLPEVSLESFGKPLAIQAQRSTTEETTPDPSEYRRRVMEGTDWAPNLPAGPFPGV